MGDDGWVCFLAEVAGPVKCSCFCLGAIHARPCPAPGPGPGVLG